VSARPDQYPYERDLATFDAIVTQAQRTIEAQVESALRTGDLRTIASRQAQLAAIDATLEQLAAGSMPLASRMVHEAWHQAAARAEQQIARLDISTAEIPGAFQGVSTEAVAAMQESLAHRLDSARQTLGRRVEDIYAREQRRAALRAILGAEGSPQAASEQLQRALSRAGQDARTGFVDSAGRRWSLDTYANMAVRTVTREAVVQGAVARMASHGIAIARVSTHPGACEICIPFQGTLVDIGEAGITDYRGEAVSDASAIPPYHPNCAHSLEPVSAMIDSLREELEQEPEGANA
jgi:hypothetical protein